MDTCFVMQCFDGGTYDKRYKETFAPAITAGGAQPIRADEILGTQPVIDKIIDKLKSSAVAFAEITEDNANVFLELGFALALNIPTVIVCDKGTRPRLPFDVAHRTVIFYATQSQSDWEVVSKKIENSIRAACAESDQSKRVIPESRIVPSQADNLDWIMKTCLLQCLEADLQSSEGTSLYSIH